jgi:LacI family gluconate utilization system Gnt-I transcriptional repressor
MLAPGTLAQVRRAIEALRYVPNLTAGSLASRRSRIVAAVVPTLSSSIFNDTIDGLSQSLARAQYQLLVGQTNYRADDEREVVDAFIGRRVDGLMLIRSLPGTDVDERLERASVPLVETWELPRREGALMVGFSNRDAGWAAGSYLSAKGYGRLGFLGSATGRGASRYAGLKAAARDAGLAEPALQPISAMASLAEAAAGFHALRAREPQLRAVLCANDMIAASVLFECARVGVDVPGSLAVMGFADLPIASAIAPRLTTVQVSAWDMGFRAGEMLLSRIGGDVDAPTRIDLGYRVIARESA